MLAGTVTDEGSELRPALGRTAIGTDAEHLYAIRERLATIETRQHVGRGELRRLRVEHDALEKRVDGMSQADEIAAAVTDALDERRRHRFNIPRKLLAGFAAVVILVPAVHDAASWWFGL
jgi:hypothetical protein